MNALDRTIRTLAVTVAFEHRRVALEGVEHGEGLVGPFVEHAPQPSALALRGR